MYIKKKSCEPLIKQKEIPVYKVKNSILLNLE